VNIGELFYRFKVKDENDAREGFDDRATDRGERETVSSRKLEEWIEEFRRLEKLNKDFLQQPKKRTRRASGREGDRT
jgi:hypothetical protein